MAFVQSKVAVDTTGTSVTLSFSGTKAGNTILVWGVVPSQPTAAITFKDNVNGNYTAAVSNSASGHHGVALAHFINGAGGTITITMTSTISALLRLGAQEVSNVTAFDQSAAGFSSTNSHNLSSGATGTLAAASEYVISVGVTTAVENFTVGSGYTADPNVTLSSTIRAVEYLPSTSSTAAQTGTFSISGGGNTSWDCLVATYQTSANSPTLSGQTVTSSHGTPGLNVGVFPTQQTATYPQIGNVTTTITDNLTAQTISTVEGGITGGIPLLGQTITSTEGNLSTALNNDVSLSLGPVTAGFVEGVLADNITYILDQGAVILVGQTATFTQGIIAEEVDYFPAAQTVTSVEGVPVFNIAALTLGAQTLTSVEGIITAQAGSAFNANLSAQTITSSMIGVSLTVSYTPAAETITSTLGTIVFSNTGDFTLTLGSQISVFTEGQLGVTGPPQGTGPPLFIPPQLGKPVTTRTFSWLEMASRAWGSEFRAPDHRIYQFSGGNYKDSTDLGTTGIYSPNLGTPDNPPQKQ